MAACNLTNIQVEMLKSVVSERIGFWKGEHEKCAAGNPLRGPAQIAKEQVASWQSLLDTLDEI